MGTLHGLFELHLVAEENEVPCAPGHRHSIGQRDLPGFIDEEEVERVFPLGPGKEPSCSAYDATTVRVVRLCGCFDVPQARIGRKKSRFCLTTDFDPIQAAS
jgi:hypothetical protein